MDKETAHCSKWFVYAKSETPTENPKNLNALPCPGMTQSSPAGSITASFASPFPTGSED